MSKLSKIVALASSALLVWAGAACAQSSDVFTLIVPFPPGGGSDTIARNLQPELSAGLARTVIIENVPGAGGSIGARKALAGEPPGSAMIATIDTVHLTPLSMAGAKYKGEDFRVVAALSSSRYVLVARPSFSMDLAQLMKYQGTLSYGILGPGSIYRLAMEDFKARTGIKANPVPYKGGPQMITDLIGGFVDLAFLPMAGPTASMIAQGKLKPLAVASADRLPSLPDVPTVREVLKVNFEYSAWAAVFVPKSIPEATVERLHNILEQAKATPAFKKFTEGTGASVIAPMTLKEGNAFYAAEMARYSALARAIKLEPV